MTANAAPTASFTATPISGRAPLLVSFDGSASRDPDGTIAGYQWAFGDGGTATGSTVQRTYNAAGTFTATLTVTDNQGATGTLSRTITVAPPVGSLSVTVKDTNGVGISGAAVVATVGGASRSGTSNASGVALLTDVLAGTGTVDVSRDSFIAKPGTAVTIAANATTSLDVTLERVTSATGGVLETRVPVGGVTDAGKTLEFSIRVVVVDDKSVEVKGLPATAFTLLACAPDAATTEADCVSGGPADVAYAVLGPGAAPSFQEIAGGAPQPYAATLMFDQSASIIRNDPTDARLFSAKEFLRSLGGSDVAAVAAFADGETAGDVRHDAIERIADAAASGTEPVVAGFATRGARRRVGAAADVAPVDVAFEAEHHLVHLPIIADGTAENRARGIEAAGAGRTAPIRRAPAAAAVDTDIQAGPVVGHVDGRLHRHGLLTARDVRRIRRTHHRHHGKCADARQNQTLHHKSPRTGPRPNFDGCTVFGIGIASSAEKQH